MGAREGYSFNKCGICSQISHNKKTCKTRQHMLIIYICSKLCKLQLLFLIQVIDVQSYCKNYYFIDIRSRGRNDSN